MGSITSHSYMFTALSIIPQLSGKNRKILKEKQFRLKDWAPLWILSDPWNSFFWGFLWWMWRLIACPQHLQETPHLEQDDLQEAAEFLALFSDLFLLGPELHCVNVKDFMVLLKREPVLNSLTAVSSASGIKDSRNWPQNGTSLQSWWEFSFPHPCHFTHHILVGCPCSLWPQRQFHFICVLHLPFSQHFGCICRQLTIITLSLTLNYIKAPLHLVYKAPLHCLNNISGPQCKWKSSPHFCVFLQSVMFVPLHKIKQNSHDKKCDPSVSSLSKNWCYQSFIIAHKTDLRTIYWIQ